MNLDNFKLDFEENTVTFKHAVVIVNPVKLLELALLKAIMAELKKLNGDKK